MIELTPIECRVLGVMVEKAQTTASQYPLTLNALTTGCNQKNNRHPVMNVSEEDALDALDALRGKKLASEVMLSGSRVSKYRHLAREPLEVSTSELVVLAELLLRGPQTVGEIRGRASRMHPLDSTEVVRNILVDLAARPEPFVQEIPPAPGSRAARWKQLLCPALHASDESSGATDTHAGSAGQATSRGLSPNSGELTARVEQLEEDVRALRSQVEQLTRELGADLV